MDEHIRHITVEGIELDVDTRKLLDPRFTYALAKVSDDRVGASDKLVWYMRMLDMVFGDDTYGIMCELQGEDGVISEERWNAFFLGAMEALGEKN